MDAGPIPTSLVRVVYSYTNMHCYDSVCPYQFYRRYIRKDVPFKETTYTTWGNAVHSAFEHRVGAQKPLPEAMRQWEPFAKPFDDKEVKVEQKLGVSKTGYPVDFFHHSVKIRGKLDLFMVNGTTAYMADWKSGSSKYESPFELEVGAMLLHAANPKLEKIVGNYVWLKESRLGQIYDLSKTGKTWAKCQDIIGRIESDKDNDSFEKKQGPLCGYCPVRDCEFNRAKDENT